jgi:hypothetical protein
MMARSEVVLEIRVRAATESMTAKACSRQPSRQSIIAIQIGIGKISEV